MFSFLQKRAVGIDIADHTIEVVEVVKIGTVVKLLNVSRVVLESGIVERGRIKNKGKLRAAVITALSSASPKQIITRKVNFALPESQVYTHVFDIELYGKDITAKAVAQKRKELVLDEIYKAIPLEKDDIVFDHRIIGVRPLSQDRIKVENIAVAASREAVLEWQNFFKELAFDIDFFDIEPFAIFRGLFFNQKIESVCIIDMGAATTTIAIFENIDLRFSYSINTAGGALTETIAHKLKVEIDKAEKMKIKNGLTGARAIAHVIEKTLDSVIQGIKESIEYYEDKRQKKVSEIVLVGGSSQLKGVVDYFTKQIDIPIRIGKLALGKSKKKSEKDLLYIGAVGTALRSLNKKWEERHPKIALIQESHIKIIIQKQESIQAQGEENVKVFRSKGNFREKKIRLQKIILTLVIIGGIGLLIGVYRYREYEVAQQQQEIQIFTTQYRLTQSFDIRIPVAVDSQEYNSDRVEGRIIKNEIMTAGSYREARAYSLIQAQKELERGEVLWENPVNSEPEKPVFPLVFQWLVYKKEDANIHFVQEIDIINKSNIDHTLNNIVKIKLEPSDNKNIYFLTGRVTVSLNQLIYVEEE